MLSPALTPVPANPVPASLEAMGLKTIASQTAIWEALARSGATAHTAMRRMNVSLSAAKEGLAEAHSRLRRRHENCLAAEEVLEASGVVRQDISRRAWDDVALGLRRA